MIRNTAYSITYTAQDPRNVQHNCRNTTLLMFAVVAAFGLAAASFVVPILPQSHAAAGCALPSADCKAFGQEQREIHQPPRP